MIVKKRSGSVVPVALLLMFLVIAMGGSIVSTLVLSNRYSRNASERIQMDYIFDAAHQRAILKYRKDVDFEGEIWKIPFEIPGGQLSRTPEDSEIWRTVKITIVSPDSQTESKEKLIQMEILLSELEDSNEGQERVWTQTRKLKLEAD